jgi:tubulin-specific chaperone D
VMGILQTLDTILKVSTSNRETLLRLITPLGDTMRRIAMAKSNNLLMRKYLIKWWTRTATLYMPPRIAAWRYQRGRRSLKENLIQGTSQSSDQKDNQPESTRLKSIEDYEIWVVPDPVEDAMGEVISGLTDSSTVVRWSAAKGVGRVTERLPAICSGDVLDAVLDLFADRERDNNWQGACLALAELSRRGLLLPHRLEEVTTKIAEAIHVSSLWEP